MGKCKQFFSLTRNLFCWEWANKRTIMGFLLGMVIPFHWIKDFLEFLKDFGEPVNVLEAFIVLIQTPRNILLYMAGWLLIVSDAPFVNKNTHYSLYRTTRRTWINSSQLYLFGQSVLYTALIALPAVLAVSPHGFVGKMWSSPVYALAKDIHFEYSRKYHVLFPGMEMMRNMNVVQAFFLTALCFLLYLLVLAEILYTFNLLLGSIFGVVCTLLIYISGYLFAADGSPLHSLMSYSVAVNFVNDRGMQTKPISTMLFAIGVGVLLQNLFCKNVDFRTNIQEE